MSVINSVAASSELSWSSSRLSGASIPHQDTTAGIWTELSKAINHSCGVGYAEKCALPWPSPLCSPSDCWVLTSFRKAEVLESSWKLKALVLQVSIQMVKTELFFQHLKKPAGLLLIQTTRVYFPFLKLRPVGSNSHFGIFSKSLCYTSILVYPL